MGHIDGCCDLLATADLVNGKLDVTRALLLSARQALQALSCWCRQEPPFG
jgi:hypothetical protein